MCPLYTYQFDTPAYDNGQPPPSHLLEKILSDCPRESIHSKHRHRTHTAGGSLQPLLTELLLSFNSFRYYKHFGVFVNTYEKTLLPSFEIYWPSDNEVDIDFAGDNYGTTINVSAVASQIELDGSGEEEPGGNPGGGEETPQSGVSILYEVTSKWIDGQNTPKHNFNITITNTTDTPINGWEISFNYPGEIVYTSGCVLVSSNPATGAYTFRNPNDYNQTINPGASVVFQGSSAVGSGSLPITAVTLNGSAVPSTAITFVSP